MTPVIRIKAELALSAAYDQLLGHYSPSQPHAPDLRHASTINAVRQEVAKLVMILADDSSDKHFNVSARLAACASYLALIPSPPLHAAQQLMIDAHRLLRDAHISQKRREFEP